MTGQTLADKLWRSHVVPVEGQGEEDLLYIDLHLLHELNTPVAFDRLHRAGRRVRRPELTLGTEDHNTPTRDIRRQIEDPAARHQVELMRRNCERHGIPHYRLGEMGQGIVHVIAPELGLTHPGMTIVCCDSHTTTLGAFGCLAFGIGTTQVEHVLATQTLPLRRPADMRVTVDGTLPEGSTAKDLALALISQIGTAGGQGCIVEYTGPAVSALSMEGRMTLCNMTVEAGSRAGVIAPDETTVAYLEGRPHAPSGQAWEEEKGHWLTLRSDADAVFDREVRLDASTVTPHVTWGTNPAQAVPLDGVVPDPADLPDPVLRQAAERAQDYMGLRPGDALRDVTVDTVFIGSCTNSRIEDLREAASVLRGRRVADGVDVVLVPGSEAVREQARAEGLEEVFRAAGIELRHAGCSMCAAVNEDRLGAGRRAASTNNRNYEGRQGKGARTHIVSPAVAAATAVTGRLTHPRDLEG